MPLTHKILVVEDQLLEREAMCRMLRGEGFSVAYAGSTHEASAVVDSSIHLVISDLRLGNESALDLLTQMRAQRSELPFIIVTAFGDVASAVSAMKLGAIDYLQKPLDPRQLLGLIRNRLNETTIGCNAMGYPGFEEMIGNSESMRTVYARIMRAAASDCSVLIVGETGTGKELVAKALHRHSKRSSCPFVASNISAIPESLIEAELFGVVKGAYTDASHDRNGMLDVAHGGTLFIDEVGELPMHVQPKLLRVIEGASYTPVGSRNERTSDVRFLFATHRDLKKLVDLELFRRDLWHRIHVLTIELPPLRDRKSDIPLLFGAFLSESCKRNGVEHLTVTRELEQFVESFDWPGNVRQLRNTVESMVVMHQETELGMKDISPTLTGDREEDVDFKTELRDIEKSAILKSLRHFAGNRTLAAHELGISVRTLQRKLKHWGLDRLGSTDDCDN